MELLEQCSPISTNHIKQCKVEIRPDKYGGYGLFARSDIRPGEIVLIEKPLLICPTDVIGMFKYFGKLSDKELFILSTVKGHINLLSKTDKEKIYSVSNDMEIRNAFQWFVAIMKCNAHGVPVSPKQLLNSQRIPRSRSFWAIYPVGARSNHSCSPNISYRSLTDQRLCYIALKPIYRGEEVCMTYIDCLFGSISLRRERLKKNKLFICQCERCIQPEDLSRCVYCPHCRRQNLRNGIHTELSQKSHPNRQGAYIQRISSNTWFCPRCQLTFEDAVVPLVVESALERLFDQLDSNFTQPTAGIWLSYLVYLSKTSKQVLGQLHWLRGGSHYLFSRFYVSLWYGGNQSSAIVSRINSHAEKFFEFMKILSFEAVMTDVLPWSSVLMRLTLRSGNSSLFCKLAQQYLDYLSLLYGHWDCAVVAYKAAYQYIENCYQSNLFPCNVILSDYARQSLEQSSTNPPNDSLPTSSRLPSLVDRLLSDDTFDVPQIHRWKYKPWKHPKTSKTDLCDKTRSFNDNQTKKILPNVALGMESRISPCVKRSDRNKGCQQRKPNETEFKFSKCQKKELPTSETPSKLKQQKASARTGITEKRSRLLRKGKQKGMNRLLGSMSSQVYESVYEETENKLDRDTLALKQLPLEMQDERQIKYSVRKGFRNPHCNLISELKGQVLRTRPFAFSTVRNQGSVEATGIRFYSPRKSVENCVSKDKMKYDSIGSFCARTNSEKRRGSRHEERHLAFSNMMHTNITPQNHFVLS